MQSIYLQQCLCNFWVLWTIKVQHLGSQAIVVRAHLVKVYHRGVGVKHSPPAFPVHLR